MPRHRYCRFIIVLALLAVVAFQLVHINDLNMHPDEELSYRATNGSLADTLYFQTSVQDNQAPLWFVSFWAWRAVVGDAEFSSRVFGILLVALALAVLTRIARQAFGRWDVAVLALLVLIGNTFFFTYALDIRPYPMVMLAAACSTWALQRWLARGGRRNTLIYGLFIALLLYVHYLLAFLVLAHISYMLIVKRLNGRLLGQGVMAGLVGLLIWLPWLPTFFDQVMGLRNIEAASGTGRGVAGIGVSTQATSLPTILTLVNLASNGLVWLYALVLVIGLIRLWRHMYQSRNLTPLAPALRQAQSGADPLRPYGRLRTVQRGGVKSDYKSLWIDSEGYALALTWALLTPAIYLIVNTVAAVYAPRFVSHTLLGLALALGAGLMLLPMWWRRLPLRAAATALFIGLNVLAFPSQIPLRIPYRELFRQVSAQAEPGDALLLHKAGEKDPFQQFMFHTYLSPELTAAMTTDLQEALKARRVWFVTGDWFADDVQRVFKTLERTHPLQTVNGQCDVKWCYLIQLLQAPPAQTPMTFGAVLPFYGVDQVSVTHDSISARLWWKADTAPLLDYSIGLHLLDANGRLVAQTDGSINHYNTRIVTTSQMQAGQIYIDYRTITLPDNIPPGSYRLSLLVYQSWDNVRLELADGADQVVVEAVAVG